MCSRGAAFLPRWRHLRRGAVEGETEHCKDQVRRAGRQDRLLNGAASRVQEREE